MALRKTSALVESAILAAITIVFAILGSYVPVVSLFANFLCPLPITLCGQRHGLKWSIMCLAVAAIVITIIVNPLQALSMAAVFGVIGLFMGECLRRHFSPLKVLAVGSVGALIAVGFSIGIGYLIMDINMVEVMMHGMDEGTKMMYEFYKGAGYTPEQLAKIEEDAAYMRKGMQLVVPSAFVLVAPFTVFINYWLARKVMSKLGEDYPWFPPFDHWCMPNWSLLGYGVGIFLIWNFQKNQEHLLYKVGFNAFVVCSMMLLVQGLAVIRWWVINRNKPKWFFSVACFLAFFIGGLSQIVVLGGAYDMIFDFRGLHKPIVKRKEEGNE